MLRTERSSRYTIKDSKLRSCGDICKTDIR